MLGFLLSGALKKEEYKPSFNLLAILIAAVYAVSDEIHQYFIPGRAMRLLDVCIDSSGAAVGALVIYLYALLKFDRNSRQINKG